MSEERQVRVDSLITTYASERTGSGHELSIEVVGIHSNLDLCKDLFTAWEAEHAADDNRETLIDRVAKILWKKYNIVSLHIGHYKKYHGGVVIRGGLTRSFLLEGETKPEGTTQTEFTTLPKE